MGVPIEPIPFTKSDKEGFPTCLKAFKKLLRGSVNERRAALTILVQYRAMFKSKPNYDISTIVDKSISPIRS